MNSSSILRGSSKKKSVWENKENQLEFDCHKTAVQTKTKYICSETCWRSKIFFLVLRQGVDFVGPVWGGWGDDAWEVHQVLWGGTSAGDHNAESGCVYAVLLLHAPSQEERKDGSSVSQNTCPEVWILCESWLSCHYIQHSKENILVVAVLAFYIFCSCVVSGNNALIDRNAFVPGCLKWWRKWAKRRLSLMCVHWCWNCVQMTKMGRM